MILIKGSRLPNQPRSSFRSHRDLATKAKCVCNRNAPGVCVFRRISGFSSDSHTCICPFDCMSSYNTQSLKVGNIKSRPSERLKNCEQRQQFNRILLHCFWTSTSKFKEDDPEYATPYWRAAYIKHVYGLAYFKWEKSNTVLLKNGKSRTYRGLSAPVFNKPFVKLPRYKKCTVASKVLILTHPEKYSAHRCIILLRQSWH